MGSYEELISAKIDELLVSIGDSMTTTDKASIKLAFDISAKRYKGITTADGKPFVLFNLDVAIIAIKEIGLGPTSAICALLHGIDLKTEYSLQNIINELSNTFFLTIFLIDSKNIFSYFSINTSFSVKSINSSL